MSIKTSYLDCRFESDIRSLVNRVNRMESLMERLLEANLSNNELMGEICKDLKVIVNKQNGKYLHESEIPEDKNEDEILIPRPKPPKLFKRKLDSASRFDSSMSIKKICLAKSKHEEEHLSENEQENKLEPITEMVNPMTTYSQIPERIESEINNIQENNVDEENDESIMEEVYLMPDEEEEIVLQPSTLNKTDKIYPLPLKNISQLKEFDLDLKKDPDLRAHMVI